jgi:hypothetical protein
MSVSQCTACKALVPQYDTIHAVSDEHCDRLLCTACFNREMAVHAGIEDFDEIKFESMHLSDASGNVHEFHFRSLLLGDKISLEAFDAIGEKQPSGYRFQILGDPHTDQFVLLGKLIEKMRRLLAVAHVRQGDLGLQIDNETIRGRIEWDGDEHSRMPCVVVDGRRVEWEELGRMLMTFEGWQFKLEVSDPSDEI